MMRIRNELRRSALLAIAGVILFGCTDPVEPAPDDLFGVWEWVRSVGGIAGVTITPETEGFTRQLRILRPNRIQLERDGVAEVVTTFRLYRAAAVYRLRYDDPLLGQTEHEMRIGQGELTLSDLCCDGFAHTWLPRLE